jgi:hypothetical protein
MDMAFVVHREVSRADIAINGVRRLNDTNGDDVRFGISPTVRCGNRIGSDITAVFDGEDGRAVAVSRPCDLRLTKGPGIGDDMARA